MSDNQCTVSLEEYLAQRASLLRTIEYGADLSNAIGNQKTAHWYEDVASVLFVKICSHAVTVHNLSPSGIVPMTPGASELWDVSSLCAVTRALIDSYFSLYYVAIEPITDEERTWRQQLWKYHEEHTRLALVRRAPANDTQRAAALETEVQQLEQALLTSPQADTLTPSQRKKIQKGNPEALTKTNSELAERAGISKTFYKMAYDFLSCYIHAYPYAIAQLAYARTNSETLSMLYQPPIEFTHAFLSIATRDVRIIFARLPSLPNLEQGVEGSIEHWTFVLNQWDSLSEAPNSVRRTPAPPDEDGQ